MKILPDLKIWDEIWLLRKGWQNSDRASNLFSFNVQIIINAKREAKAEHAYLKLSDLLCHERSAALMCEVVWKTMERLWYI